MGPDRQPDSTSAVGNRGQVNYSAAKAGMQGFTKTLAIELGKYGVTANAIAPGFIVTDMTAATAARLGVSFEDFQAGAAKEIPVQRVGQPEDIAQAVSFFVSDAAGFVSGQVLYVAGGPVYRTIAQREQGGTALSDSMSTDRQADEADLRARIRTFCADHDPASTPRDQFLSDRFDAGLAAVHYPVGHGGLGLPRSLQQAAEEQFARAGAPAPDPGRNVIGLGMAAPTLIAFGTDQQLDRWLKPLWLAEEIWCQLFSEPGRGQRPGQPGHPRGPRRRRLGGQRPEGVDLARAPRPLGPAAGPHRPRRAQARRA